LAGLLAFSHHFRERVVGLLDFLVFQVV
jgi:hypothetical protein